MDKVENEVPSWKEAELQGTFPKNAVESGRDNEGNLIYVGRFEYEGNMLPAKVLPAKVQAFAYWHACESKIYTDRYEVLTGLHHFWLNVNELPDPKALPDVAVCVGQSDKKVDLYVGRNENKKTPGIIISTDYEKRTMRDSAKVELTWDEILVKPFAWIKDTAPKNIRNAVKTTDANGVVYVGCTEHDDVTVPVKIQSNQGCILNNDHKVVDKKHFNVLIGYEYEWLDGTKNSSYSKAVAISRSNNEYLYIGKFTDKKGIIYIVSLKNKEKSELSIKHSKNDKEEESEEKIEKFEVLVWAPKDYKPPIKTDNKNMEIN